MARPPRAEAGDHWRALGAIPAVLVAAAGVAAAVTHQPAWLTCLCGAAVPLCWLHFRILGAIADALVASRQVQGHEK